MRTTTDANSSGLPAQIGDEQRQTLLDFFLSRLGDAAQAAAECVRLTLALFAERAARKGARPIKNVTRQLKRLARDVFIDRHLEQIYREFSKPLLDYFLPRVRNAADAEECVSAVISRYTARVKRKDLREINNPAHYIARMKKRVLLDFRDRERKDRGKTNSIDAQGAGAELGDVKDVSPRRDPEKNAELEERRRLFFQFLKKEYSTPARATELKLILMRYRGLTSAEIAAALGGDPAQKEYVSQVARDVNKAMMNLRNRFKKFMLARADEQ